MKKKQTVVAAMLVAVVLLLGLAGCDGYTGLYPLDKDRYPVQGKIVVNEEIFDLPQFEDLNEPKSGSITVKPNEKNEYKIILSNRAVIFEWLADTDTEGVTLSETSKYVPDKNAKYEKYGRYPELHEFIFNLSGGVSEIELKLVNVRDLYKDGTKKDVNYSEVEAAYILTIKIED